MLQIPRSITVHVSLPDSSPVSDVLVYLNTYVNGGYYFGDILGLTDSTGRATMTGQELEKHFIANRGMFLMDYRVDLRECDPLLGLGIAGGSEFQTAREQTAELDYVLPEIKDWYRAARNTEYTSTEARYDVQSENSQNVELMLVVQPLDT